MPSQKPPLSSAWLCFLTALLALPQHWRHFSDHLHNLQTLKSMQLKSSKENREVGKRRKENLLVVGVRCREGERRGENTLCWMGRLTHASPIYTHQKAEMATVSSGVLSSTKWGGEGTRKMAGERVFGCVSGWGKLWVLTLEDSFSFFACWTPTPRCLVSQRRAQWQNYCILPMTAITTCRTLGLYCFVKSWHPVY